MEKDWRCKCGKLLGVLDGGRLHIRFARGYQYMVGFPVSTVCRDCGALNEIDEGGLTKATRE